MHKVWLFILISIGVVNTCQAEALRSIHVFVALCDNESQGIVPVPETFGNGDDPRNNLYWGALYGVKTHFKKSSEWTLLESISKPSEEVLERCVFRHKNRDVYLVADAYRGREIKTAINHFLESATVSRDESLLVQYVKVPLYSKAQAIAYVGHNGLMDFTVPEPQSAPSSLTKLAVVLACQSEPYFDAYLAKNNCSPRLLTTGFMAPEAYTLEGILNAWVNEESA